MLNDLLFEIGTEELPSLSVQPLAEALKEHVSAKLTKAGIQYGQARCFASPRRIAVLIEAVSAQQQAQHISRRGPALAQGHDAEGNPSAALVGFAKSCGVSIDALTTVESDKGAWWVYEAHKTGELTCSLLPQLLQEAVALLPVPKGMRWGYGDVVFARPVHWIVLLYGEQVIDTTILGVQTGRHSLGHRFHAPEAIAINTPKEYEHVLQKAYVMADFDKRRQLIQQQIEALALTQQKQAVVPDALLHEVTSIVEWPHALLAHFDEKFLNIPQEALIAAMQSHQKSFALCDNNARLAPCFVTVANIESLNERRVVAGNEKVMRARLSDAQFFYQQDSKYKLAEHIDGLKHVVFQEKLGSLYDKTTRIALFMDILKPLLALDAKQAARSAKLSKCDLLTGMVGEFPELQGLMGYYYALHDGEDHAVAVALNEQYMPRFSADGLPASRLGQALSLADRMDTLVGTFSIGQKPSGVKDPFKLRRHALAVARILMTLPVPVTLSELIEHAAANYAAANQEALAALKPFIIDRLISYYQGAGISPDLIQATLACQDECLYDFDKRLHALQRFIGLPEASALSNAAKRVNHLLQHAKANHVQTDINESLLQAAAEQNLYQSMMRIQIKVDACYQQQNYDHALASLAALKDPIDAFFDTVMVMTEEDALRRNRLCLLSQLQAVLHGVVNISLLQHVC